MRVNVIMSTLKLSCNIPVTIQYVLTTSTPMVGLGVVVVVVGVVVVSVVVVISVVVDEVTPSVVVFSVVVVISVVVDEVTPSVVVFSVELPVSAEGVVGIAVVDDISVAVSVASGVVAVICTEELGITVVGMVLSVDATLDIVETVVDMEDETSTTLLWLTVVSGKGLEAGVGIILVLGFDTEELVTAVCNIWLVDTGDGELVWLNIEVSELCSIDVSMLVTVGEVVVEKTSEDELPEGTIVGVTETDDSVAWVEL